MDIKQSIEKLVRERASLESKILKLGPILEGSLITRYVSCGNPGCRCSSKKKSDLHGPYYYLSKKVRGKTKLVYLSDRQGLAKLARDYRDFQSALRQIRSLNRRIEKLFISLRSKKMR